MGTRSRLRRAELVGCRAEWTSIYPIIVHAAPPIPWPSIQDTMIIIIRNVDCQLTASGVGLSGIFLRIIGMN